MPTKQHIGILLLALPFLLAPAAGAASDGAEAGERAQLERRSERFRQRAGRRALRGREFRFGRLGLTEEQRDQLREALRENRDQRRANADEVAEARRSLREAARDPERSAEDIRALGEALGRAQADGILGERAGRERIAAILTEEQRERMEDFRERGSRRRRR